MSVIEEINHLKNDLLMICEKIKDLEKQGIRVEFQIANGQLTNFGALQQMKLSS